MLSTLKSRLGFCITITFSGSFRAGLQLVVLVWFVDSWSIGGSLTIFFKEILTLLSFKEISTLGFLWKVFWKSLWCQEIPEIFISILCKDFKKNKDIEIPQHLPDK